MCDLYEIYDNNFNYYHYQPGYMANTSRTHTPTHRRPGCRCSMGRSAPNHDEVNAPFSPVPVAMNGRSVLNSNKQSRVRRGIRDSFGCFSRIQKNC